MGRKYAALQGEHRECLRRHRGTLQAGRPSDRVPTDPVSIAVALADKLDTLAGFWAIDEKPTGSKDPFALRRAALGVIRLILDRGPRLRLLEQVGAADRGLAGRAGVDAQDLLGFFADRLKVYLRDQGARHDLIDAVFALPGQDDLLMVVRRVEALGQFLDTEDGKNLLAGYKRAANILRIEEKKDGRAYDAAPDAALAAAGEPAERALAEALAKARETASAAVAREDFSGAMQALSTLRAPVDAFFQDVTVNAPDPKLRENRLALLNALRAATREVADFSKIEGEAQTTAAPSSPSS